MPDEQAVSVDFARDREDVFGEIQQRFFKCWGVSRVGMDHYFDQWRPAIILLPQLSLDSGCWLAFTVCEVADLVPEKDGCTLRGVFHFQQAHAYGRVFANFEILVFAFHNFPAASRVTDSWAVGCPKTSAKPLTDVHNNSLPVDIRVLAIHCIDHAVAR